MPGNPSHSITLSVLRAGKQLRDAPDDVAREMAATRLVVAAERSIAQFDNAVTQAFAGAGAVAAVLPAAQTDEVLAAALRQVQVVNTVFAAGRVLDEDSDPDRAVLAGTLAEFDAVVPLIDATENVAARGFQSGPAPVPGDFRKLVAEAYAGFASRSAKTIATSISGIRDRGPEAIRGAWSWAKEKLELDKIGGRLVKLGLRALLGVLRLLSRLIPAERTESLRERVERLIAAVDRGSPATALTGAALGVDEAARRSDSLLRKEDLDQDRLGKCVLDLGAVTTRHGRAMELCDGIAVAIALAGKFALAVPHLPLFVLGGQVLLIAAVVVIGRDCTGDAGAIVEGAVA